MVRWPATLVASLMVVLLAGCLQSEPGPDDSVSTGPADPVDSSVGDTTVDNSTAPSTDGPLPPVSFEASGCTAVVPLSVDEYGAIDDILPPGFHPADVVSLLRLQDGVFSGQGAIGTIMAHCASNTLTGESFSLALPGTLVYTPNVGVNTSYVDGYEHFVGVSDPALADLFEAYGWDVERGLSIEIAASFDQGVNDETGESQIPGYGSARVIGSVDGAQVFEAAVVASATYHTRDGDLDELRFWYDGDAGLSYIENVLDKNGKSGSAYCTYAAGSRYAEAMGRTSCDEGTGAIGLVITDFNLQTTLVLLDGVHA